MNEIKFEGGTNIEIQINFISKQLGGSRLWRSFT